MNLIDEELVEIQGIEWFKDLGYDYKNGFYTSLSKAVVLLIAIFKNAR